jgi:hypothetical protein
MHTLRVTELDLNNKRDVKSFINLPYNIYEKIPQWIPPLRHEMALTMNLRKNPYFADSTAAFFLVFNEKTQPIGRIACLNNKRFNDFNHKKTAFFTLFESYDVPKQQSFYLKSHGLGSQTRIKRNYWAVRFFST